LSAPDEHIGIALRLYVDPDAYNKVIQNLNQLQQKINGIRLNIQNLARTRAPVKIGDREIRARSMRPEVIRSIREEYDKFVETNADLIKRMQLSSKVWNDIIRMTKMGAVSQADLNRLADEYADIAGITVTQARRQVRVLQALQREQRATRLWRDITTLATSGTARQRDLNAAVAMYAKEIGRTQRDVRQWVSSYQQMARQQRIAAVSAQSLRYRQGLLGQTMRELGGTVFWLGLGLMFMVMSIQRVNRALYSITIAARSVTRAQEDLKLAQEEYTRTLFEFGPGSQEARMAYLRVRDAQEAVRMSQIRVREAQENYINSILMFVFGTIPTFIRAGISLYDILTKIIVTKYLATRVTDQMTQSEMQHLAVEVAGKPVRTMAIALTKAQTLATSKLAIVTSIATVGIGALIGVLGYLYMQQQMNLAMTEANTESYQKLEDTLTGHSVVDSLIRTREEMRKLNEEFTRLPLRSHSPLEIKTQYGWANLGVLEDIDVGLGRRLSVTSTNVQVGVTVNGPFYIREEADVQKIAKAVKKSLTRGVRSRVGGVMLT